MNPSAISIPGLAFAYRYAEVGSTMDAARELAPQVASVEGGVGLVCAERQTAGRGRQGRSWSGSGRSFMGTFLLGAKSSPQELSGYSLAVGCAVASSLSGLGATVMLKWPNDIVVVRGGELFKLGGILVEVQEHLGARVLLAGIGLNLLDSPSEVAQASSVLRECGVSIQAQELEEPLSLSMLSMHRRFTAEGGFSAFAAEWMQRSCLEPGRSSLSVDLGSSAVSGVFQGLDLSGAMLIECSGEIRTVHSGHVISMGGLRG